MHSLLRPLLPLPATLFLTTLLASPLILGGCEQEKKAKPKLLATEPELPARARPVGLHPDDFRCQAVAGTSAVSLAVGLDVQVELSSFPAPDGVPRGCNYTGMATQPAFDGGPVGPRSWTFDVDCRPTALRDGRSLLAQYMKHEDSTQIGIGEAAVDHRNVVLLFIDDDTPCYARVMGPGAPQRLALAKLVATGLTPKTAPARRSTY